MSNETVPPGQDIHPFLRGNFAPVASEFISHPCDVVRGEIPAELLGGQYIRNGGNPVYPPEKGRHYHWFDGDGMLHGVLFPKSQDGAPLFTNRHLATPLLTLTLLLLRSPIPSIALLISPLSSLHRIIAAIIQSFLIAVRARLGVLSVANTSVVWWGTGMGTEAQADLGQAPDQRLLATCESGPPLEVRVPELDTVGWDRLVDKETGESLSHRRENSSWWKRFTLAAIQEDWMTAHPRIDPVDGSLLFYSTQMFDAPHARYSVIDRHGKHLVWKKGINVGRAKMMHDFAATRTHTILLNLPLTLSPANLFSTRPVPLIHFDRQLPSEFVIFPRLLADEEPMRFTDSEPSLIFHTANAWNEYEGEKLVAINMLSCRFKSAKLVYAAGAVDIPLVEKRAGEDDVVQLYYHRFLLPQTGTEGRITHCFPLSALPFEFPTVATDLGMSDTRFVYGCTMKSGSFDERLGGAAKVDCLVKLDVQHLVQSGRKRGAGKSDTPVDERTSPEIMARAATDGSIQIFPMPEGFYAQEPRFIPRKGDNLTEDDGFLLTYVYDESHLLPDGTPSTAADAGSELWVIDAKRMSQGMSAVLCRIKLPQRVPYGLHGTWLPASFASRQRRLSNPNPPQALLQDKLALSRVQAFASILFSRPKYREKSTFERIILGVLWPGAFVILVLGAYEVWRTTRSVS